MSHGGVLKAESCARASKVAYLLRKNSSSSFPWHLTFTPVCASTELVLSELLQEKLFLQSHPSAVCARAQRYGRGQRNRLWLAPKGGVWISAAVPWLKEHLHTGIFGMAIALSLSIRLERYGLVPKIKWPNDLLIGNSKLAGMLPRLVHRGNRVRFARIGLGLNVVNKVPDGGVSLKKLLPLGKCQVDLWTVEVLIAIEQAMSYLDNPNWICQQVDKRLWLDQLIAPSTGKLLKIEGIDLDGGLKVRDGSEISVWTRW